MCRLIGCRTAPAGDDQPPADWNALASDRVFVFRYQHERIKSSADDDRIVVKCIYLEKTLQVHAGSLKEPSRVCSLELNVADFMSLPDENDDDVPLRRKLFYNIDRLRQLVKQELVDPLLRQVTTTAAAAHARSSRDENAFLERERTSRGAGGFHIPPVCCCVLLLLCEFFLTRFSL